MLHVRDLEVTYGAARAVERAFLDVEASELVALVGRNGAGKTTLLRAISGLVRARRGSIVCDDMRLDGLPPHKIVKAGVAHVAQGRYLFGGMTVLENLEVAIPRGTDRGTSQARFEEVFEMFGMTHARRFDKARNLSGGQQQMVAIARALMTGPKVLLLDEPSTGLAPSIVDILAEKFVALRDRGLAILLVEQNAALALDLASRAYVMNEARIIEAGDADELKDKEIVRKAYLGELAVEARGGTPGGG